jgi:N4-(beta-N-acetylglucosaminyl)-L-asparaginase
MTRHITTSSRRTFLTSGAAGLLAGPLLAGTGRLATHSAGFPQPDEFPVKVIASGNGLAATRKAWDMIVAGADVLDGVVAGVNLVEEDPRDTSVGYGGLPNERGVVQLDAACMHGPSHQAGAVACLENIKYPSQVAKRVLWRTDHVLLVGEGARDFARIHGFTEENLLTDRTRQIWLRWKETLSDRDDWLPPEDEAKQGAAATGDDQAGVDYDGRYDHGIYDHGEDIDVLVSRIRRYRPTGTIHCSGMDASGNLSCTTTTSGLAFKIPGRVGDSPIIGAGLYCDNEIGSCGSTGRGEANLHNLCSFAAVELMRSGMEPAEAGLEVLRRVVRHSHPRLLNEAGEPDFGLQFYLIRKDGKHAGVTMRGRGKFAVTDKDGSRKEDLVSLF